MIALDIACHRLYNQQIVQNKFELPSHVVAWFGAMQAQDYAGAKWAISLRCHGAPDAIIEQAIVKKAIVRTWLMRGTLQVVEASDVHWMLALLAPRLIAGSAGRYRQLELDEATFAHSFKTLARALQGGKQLTRREIMTTLGEAGISTTGQRGYHILRQAGLKGHICFGPIQDKQQTFVLLDEWIPHSKKTGRDEALAVLAERYFRSHGPATLQDFVWWSGLPAADARAGLETAKACFYQETIEERTYWLPQDNSIPKDPSPTAYLLPAFDEYFLGYKVRNAVLDSKYDKQAVSRNGVFRPMIVIDGQVVGTWKRVLKKDTIIITPGLFNPLTTAENQALLAAADPFGAFLGLPVVLTNLNS